MDNISAPNTVSGLLIVGITALAAVVVYLFKSLMSRMSDNDKERREEQKAMADERAQWSAKETRMLADHESEIDEIKKEYETKYKELLERELAEIKELRDSHQAREDDIRKSFDTLMIGISDRNQQAATSLAAALEKIHERFLGPRPPRRGG